MTSQIIPQLYAPAGVISAYVPEKEPTVTGDSATSLSDAVGGTIAHTMVPCFIAIGYVSFCQPLFFETIYPPCLVNPNDYDVCWSRKRVSLVEPTMNFKTCRLFIRYYCSFNMMLSINDDTSQRIMA